jgi:hypothetical protein
MLSANEVVTDKTNHSLLRHAVNVQTASGFMVNKKFAPTLYANFKEGAEKLEEAYNAGIKDFGQYCVDQYWKQLQPGSNWYIFFPKLGKQRKSVSDIAGGIVDYGCG